MINNKNTPMEGTICWHDESRESPENPGLFLGIYMVGSELVPFPVRFLKSCNWVNVDGSDTSRPVYWAECSIPTEIRIRACCD